MKNMPNLTICIPTYNRAKFLCDTLESIITQITDDIEIVVTDNASNDNTTEIVKNYQGKCSNIIYYRHEKNVGADLNYLKTVELANGKYCWLFGSDDIMKPGAIDLILNEIKSNYDVYLCGLMLCTYDMKPIAEHLILHDSITNVYDLSKKDSRYEYFENAITTTAFFSFLGSLIVSKEKWEAVHENHQQFIGSLWVHVAKIFGMIEYGLKVKFINTPLLFKRGDNDSFIDKGIARRIGVSIYGYRKIIHHYFGPASMEADHVDRVLKYEWPLSAFIFYKQTSLKNNTKNMVELDKVFIDCYNSNSLQDRYSRYIYKSYIASAIYNFLFNVKYGLKKILKR